MSLPHWVPSSGESNIWISQCVEDGVNPRNLINHVIPNLQLPDTVDDSSLWHLIADILSEPEKRQKLSTYNTIGDVLDLLRKSQKIIVLTGAGVSVSCGIPDFRSKNGIYARLHRDFPDLPDPQAMFDIDYFRSNPRPFFDFAKEIFPGQFKPSLCHYFIKMIQDQGKLLRNYTQNIDTLEQVAGITDVVQCHGSFATATCYRCKHKVDCDYIKSDVMEKKIPRCPRCPSDAEFAVLKPDIVFFGENLPKEFHDQILADKTEADLLIVIGSSLKVRPVALIPNCLPNEIPQILINREPLTHMNFDIELLGNCDNIVNELCLQMGSPWDSLCLPSLRRLRQISKLPPTVESFQTQLSLPTACVAAVASRKLSRSSTDEYPEPVNKKIRRSNDVERRNADDDDNVPLSLLSASSVASTSNGKVDDAASSSATTVDKMDKFKTNFHKILTHDIEGLRKMYKPRMQKVSSLLPADAFLFISPNRYVFEGAEVFRELEVEHDDDDTSSVESSSVSDSEQTSSSENSNDCRSSSSESEEDSSKLSAFSGTKRTLETDFGTNVTNCQ